MFAVSRCPRLLSLLLLGPLACGGSVPAEPVVQQGRVSIQLGGVSNPFGISIGGNLTLHAVALDFRGRQVNPQPQISFRSSAPSILQVTPSGELTGLTSGTALVIAEVIGNPSFKPDTVTVMVIQVL